MTSAPIKLSCYGTPMGRPRREVLGAQDIAVLRHLAAGKTRDEIADVEGASASGVSKWILQLRHATGCRTDAHLVAKAKDNGLI